MIYVGLKDSYTAFHIEDWNLCSLKYLAEDFAKIWIIIDKSIRAELTSRFAKYLQEHSPDTFVCPQSLEHKVFSIKPQLLDEWGIPHKIVIQNPGDSFFTRNGAYRSVVNMGRNIAEAVNVGSDVWNSSYDPPVCTCTDNHRKHVPQDRTIVYSIKRMAKRLSVCDAKNCNRSFNTKSQLWAHKKLKHNYRESFTCPECSKNFSKKSDLTRHLKTHEPVLLEKCPICSLEVRNVKAHVADVHSEERPTCPKCGLKIKKYNYQRHYNNCQVSCRYCKKVCKSTKYLKQHLNSVHNTSVS